MKIRALALVAALALPGIATADDQQPGGTTSKPGDTTTGKTNDPSATKPGKLATADIKFVAHFHKVNQSEIELGKLAQKTGSSAGVKSYGAALVSDHQGSDKELTAFARSHGVATIPADKPETDADRQDEKDMATHVAHLKTLKGAEFDKAFVDMMANGHDKELAKIDVAIGAAADANLQALLKTTKPVLQRHADQARDLQKGAQAALDAANPSQPSGAMNQPPRPSQPQTPPSPNAGSPSTR